MHIREERVAIFVDELETGSSTSTLRVPPPLIEKPGACPRNDGLCRSPIHSHTDRSARYVAAPRDNNDIPCGVKDLNLLTGEEFDR